MWFPWGFPWLVWCLFHDCGLLSIVIFGCLCSGCGRVMVCLSFTRGVGLVFFGWFACWPCMWGLVRCWWSLCSGCCLPLLLGGKAFAFFPVFPGFCRACPAGLGYSVFRLFWGPLASCIVLGYLLGFSLLEINSYLSKKKKKLT